MDPIRISGNIHGFQFHIRDNGIGYLCGYLLIPNEILEQKPLFDGDDGFETYEGYVSAHGGVTYANEHLIGEDRVEILKDYLGTWIGFDCAHSGDLPHPKFVSEHPRSFILPGQNGTFKDEHYVYNCLCEMVLELEPMGWIPNRKEKPDDINILEGVY